MSTYCDIHKIIIREHLVNNESKILKYFFPTFNISNVLNLSQYYKLEYKVELMLKFGDIESWNINNIIIYERSGASLSEENITYIKNLFQIRPIKKNDLAEILSNFSWNVTLVNNEGLYFTVPVLMREIIKSIINQKNDNIDIIANAI